MRHGDPMKFIRYLSILSVIGIGLLFPIDAWSQEPAKEGMEPDLVIPEGAKVPPREWKTAKGKGTTLFAKLLGIEDGTVVLLRKDGSKAGILLEKLSKDDQKYLKRYRKRLNNRFPGTTPTSDPTTPLLGIRPEKILSSSEHNALTPPGRLLRRKGAGLIAPFPHLKPPPKTMPAHDRMLKHHWFSNGGPIQDQYILFDLGAAYQLTQMIVWPFAVTKAQKQSVKSLDLYLSGEAPAGKDLEAIRKDMNRLVERHAIAQPSTQGVGVQPTILSFDATLPVRYVLIDIQENFNSHDPSVGLGKIRFVGHPAE